MTKRSATFAAALAAALSACADRTAEPVAAAPGTRDSAGVQIVQSVADAAVPVWRIFEEALVEVGGPDAGFVTVTSALRTKEAFVVADAETGELRVYDPQGRAVRKTGGKGRGPGEFQYIGWMGLLPGDSLAAWDPLLRRVSVFAPDGMFARSFAPAGLEGFFPSVYGAFDDGSLLFSNGMESASTPPSSSARRDTMLLLRIKQTGEIVDTTGRFPGPSRFAAAGSGGAGRTHSLPFGPATSAVARGNHLYISTGDRYEIAIHTTDGQLQRLIRHHAPPVPVTRRDREAYVANMLQSGGTPEEQRERQAELASAPFPRTMAPIDGLRVDEAGNVWVREAQAPDTWDKSSLWSVFDQAGRRIAKVEAPGRFAPHQIGPDWVLAGKVDSSGIERVRLYRLQH